MNFTICTLILAISQLASCQQSTGLKLQQQGYPSTLYGQWSPSQYRAQYPSVYGQRLLSQYYYPQSQYQPYAQPTARGGILSRFRGRLNSKPVLGGFFSRFREISAPQLGQSSDPASGGLLSRLRRGPKSQSGLLSSLSGNSESGLLSGLLSSLKGDSDSGLLSGILERLRPQASSSSKDVNAQSSLLESARETQFLRALEKSKRAFLEAKLRRLQGQLPTAELTEPKWKVTSALTQSEYESLFGPRRLSLSDRTLQTPAYPLSANNQPSTPAEDESEPQTPSPKTQTIPEPKPFVEKAEQTAESSSDTQKTPRFTSLSSSPARVLPKVRPEGLDQLLSNTQIIQDSIVLVDTRLKTPENPQSSIEIEVAAPEPQPRPQPESLFKTEYQSEPQAQTGFRTEYQSEPQAQTGFRTEYQSEPQAQTGFRTEYQSERQAQTGFNTEYQSEPQAQTGFKTEYQPEAILQTEYNVQAYIEPVPVVLESGRAELVPFGNLNNTPDRVDTYLTDFRTLSPSGDA